MIQVFFVMIVSNISHKAALIYSPYGTAQLQDNVCTHQEHVQNASGMHAGCTWDVFRTRLAQNLVIKLLLDRLTRLPRSFSPDMGRIQNACGTRLECVQNTSGTCANINLELSCTVYQVVWTLLSLTLIVCLPP